MSIVVRRESEKFILHMFGYNNLEKIAFYFLGRNHDEIPDFSNINNIDFMHWYEKFRETSKNRN